MTATLQESPSRQNFLDIPDCEFTPVSLTLPPKLSYDHWERIGRQLQLADMAIQWWIGDWLNYGEHNYYDRYSQALEESTGRSKQTLMNYAYVAGAIPISRRRENVDFSTHAEVASLDEEDQERILAKAAKEGTPKRLVRREADKVRRAKRPKPEDDAVVMSKEAREFLDDYMAEISLWTENVPSTIPASEREALEKMLFGQGSNALWLKNRTRESDYTAIRELFSFDEGTPGMERAGRADISSWLEKCGYYMSDADLDERLDVMVESKMLQVKSVEDSRQEGRRGAMLDLYALHPDYEAALETH